jgi:KDO2-lipid IV(A) lauroyltransferase
MKKFRLLSEYIGLKLLIILIGILPWGIAVKFGEGLGVLLSKFLPNRYKRTIKDIQKAFPEKTPEEAQKIALESWRNIGRLAAETAQAAISSKEKLFSKIEIRNADKAMKDNAQGKAGLIHIGHFTNWEIYGLMSGALFTKIAFIARPQSNKYVDKELTKIRTKYGGKMINAYNPFYSCFKALKQGYMIGILSDQSVSSAKLYMNFLNRPAEVAPLTAMLAIKMQLPVYPVRVFRENSKIVGDMQQAVYPPKEYSHEALFSFTRQLQEIYEGWIRLDPGSWLWAHNRWRREHEAARRMKGGPDAR